MRRTFGLVLFLAFAPCDAKSQPPHCTTARDDFARMNQPMFVGPKSTTADVASYEKNKEAATEALHKFLVRSILTELARVGPDNAATDLPVWVECVQSGVPQYAALKEGSDVPSAYALSPTTPSIMVIYELDRGYEAIPQTTYFLEVYSLLQGAWQLSESETPHQFDAASLSAFKMTDGPAGQHRFLLAGRHYGDTGASLYLEMLGFDGRAFQELWSEVRPRTWVVRVSQEGVVLGSEVVDQNGHNAHEVTTTFTVEKHGLQPVP